MVVEAAMLKVFFSMEIYSLSTSPIPERCHPRSDLVPSPPVMATAAAVAAAVQQQTAAAQHQTVRVEVGVHVKQGRSLRNVMNCSQKKRYHAHARCMARPQTTRKQSCPPQEALLLTSYIYLPLKYILTSFFFSRWVNRFPDLDLSELADPADLDDDDDDADADVEEPKMPKRKRSSKKVMSTASKKVCTLAGDDQVIQTVRCLGDVFVGGY